MKKILISFLLLSGIASAQSFVPEYWYPVGHAANCSPDSSRTYYSNGGTAQTVMYTYDAARRLLKKDYTYASNNQREITTYAWDANDSLVMRAVAAGVPTATNMVRMSRNQAKLVTEDTAFYGSSGVFTPNLASSYVYDVSNRVSEITRSYYSNGWGNFNRLEFTRDASGKLLSTLFQGWVNSAWQNSNLTTYTNNPNGDVTDLVFQFWNNSASAWVNGSRVRYAYTGTHRDTTTYFSWSGTWTRNSRQIDSPTGAVDSVTLENWESPQWVGTYRYVRTWSQGRMTSLIERKFLNGSWQNAWKYEYLYDAAGNNTETKLFAYNNTFNNWDYLSPAKHYYTCSTVGLAERALPSISAYPVPSGGIVQFAGGSAVAGGMVRTASGAEAMRFLGSTADLSALQHGMYFISLELSDGSTRVVKVVRE